VLSRLPFGGLPAGPDSTRPQGKKPLGKRKCKARFIGLETSVLAAKNKESGTAFTQKT
jgi:hypothetical protein